MPSLAEKRGNATDISKPHPSEAPISTFEYDIQNTTRSRNGDEANLASTEKYVAGGEMAPDRGIDLEDFNQYADEIRQFYDAYKNEQDETLNAYLRSLQDQLVSWRQGFRAYKTKREMASGTSMLHDTCR